MTTGRCGTDADANKLGVIRLPRGVHGRPPRHPYIWATWLPRLLIGENSCEWAVWFKAHYQDWTRTPSEFNQTECMLNHTALLNKRKANWKQVGFDVNIEGQNSFELHGRSATLAGQLDLITRRDEEAVIIDAKTGHESPSHIVQVMIYLYAIPRALEPYRNLKLSGQVTYLDHTARIPAEAVDDQFIQNLGTLIRRLAADKPPARVPSKPECRFCHISALDCPERMNEGSEPEGRTTTDF